MASTVTSPAVMYALMNDSAAEPASVGCRGWPAIHHRLIHLAHLCFLAAFVVPHTFRLSAATMRLILCAGLVLVAVWAGAFVCAPDALAWSVLLAAVNAAHAAKQLVTVRPPERAPAPLRPLHRRLFAPLRVPAAEFARLVRGAEMRRLARGGMFAKEGVTRTGGQLAILLTGELVVTCDGCPLHRVSPYQFINSPEWEADETGGRVSMQSDDELNCKPPDPNPIYQVSIIATEESTYLTWSADALSAVLRSNAFLHAVVFNLVGKDITQKLYRVNETARCGPWSQSQVRRAPLVRRRSEEPPPVERRPAVATHRRRSLGPPPRRREMFTPGEIALLRWQTEARPNSAGSRSDTQLLCPGRLLGSRLPPMTHRRPAAPHRIHPADGSAVKSAPFAPEVAARYNLWTPPRGDYQLVRGNA